MYVNRILILKQSLKIWTSFNIASHNDIHTPFTNNVGSQCITGSKFIRNLILLNIFQEISGTIDQQISDSGQVHLMKCIDVLTE